MRKNILIQPTKVSIGSSNHDTVIYIQEGLILTNL